MAVAALVALASCGGRDRELAQSTSDTAAARTSDTAAEATSSSRKATTTSAPAGQPTTTASPAPATLGTVEADVPTRFPPRGQVRVRLELLSLERLPGELVEARFRLTNLGTGDYQPANNIGIEITHFDASGAALLDLVNGRRYPSVLDASGSCLCTRFSPVDALGPGESRQYYSRIAAPPTSVARVDFELPGFPPLRQAPLA